MRRKGKRSLAAVMAAMMLTAQPMWAAENVFSDGMNPEELFISAKENHEQEEPAVFSGEEIPEAEKIEDILPEVITRQLPVGEIGKEYYEELKAESHNGRKITWKLADGEKLPEGITLSEDGILSGIPLERGKWDFYVIVSNQDAEVTEYISFWIYAQSEEITPTPIPEKEYDLGEDEEVSLGEVPLGYTETFGWFALHNKGRNALHIKSVSELKNFTLDTNLPLEGELSSGGKITGSFKAKQGLSWGVYKEDFVVTTEEGIEKTYHVTMTVGPSSDKEYEISYEPAEHTEFKYTKEYWDTADDIDDLVDYDAIIIRNRGKKDITVRCSKPENFDIWYDTKKIAPGAKCGINIYPKKREGVYSETLYVSVSDGTELEYTISQNVPHVPLSEEIVKIGNKKLDFGKDAVCYPEAPKEQKVTITNITNETIHLRQGNSGQWYEKSRLSKETLEPGEKAFYYVQPRTGLNSGKYGTWLNTDNAGFWIWDYQGYNVWVNVTANFEVTPYCIKELKQPEPVKGLTNGKEKTAEALKLPVFVQVILQEKENPDDSFTYIKVNWDVENCSYDSKNKEEQNFTVNGVIELPDYMKNYNNADLHTSVDVQVNAYEHLGKPVITEINETNENNIWVKLKDSVNDADGYDYALGLEENFTETGKIVQTSENNTKLATYIEKVQKGEYYVSCRAYQLIEGKKTFSQWADPVKVTVKARRPEQAVVKSVKVQKDMVTVTLAECKDSIGFDAVLAKKHDGSQPLEYAYIEKNKETNTIVFKRVKNGTYYLGVHAYNYDASKCIGDWSKLCKIVVKDGAPAGNPKIERAKVNKNKIAMAVSMPKGFQGYDAVLVNTKNNYTYAYVLKNEKGWGAFYNVKPGTYELRVHAWAKCRGQKVFSDWVTWPKKFTVK